MLLYYPRVGARVEEKITIMLRLRGKLQIQSVTNGRSLDKVSTNCKVPHLGGDCRSRRIDQL